MEDTLFLDSSITLISSFLKVLFLLEERSLDSFVFDLQRVLEDLFIFNGLNSFDLGLSKSSTLAKTEST